MEAQSISLTHIRAAQLELVQEEAADNQKDARDQGQLMVWLCNESHLLFFFLIFRRDVSLTYVPETRILSENVDIKYLFKNKSCLKNKYKVYRK